MKLLILLIVKNSFTFNIVYPTLIQFELELLDKECFLPPLFREFQNDVGLFISPLGVLDRESPFLTASLLELRERAE